MDVFRVLGNSNRRSMLKILLNTEMHISALARELNISVPVALRHANCLEGAGLVERKEVGNSHVLTAKKEAMEKLKSLWDLMDQPLIVRSKKGKTMLDCIKKMPGIKIGVGKEGHFISSVDGKKGYFIYEINGKFVEKSLEDIKVEKNSTLELKRLLPVLGKKIQIEVE
ncbi:MAG: ArsR family transcriptional regulator [Candidatus Diapherotrites archaeon]|uniref:ArsR family transcriptional regulator n=1 Tax=Candidatus Iainarchaeum sp. TaxID=3101447 RepID=A0A2D6M0Z3_9ARCH|nr:ArsR family transcriptional regulator [Candidatus Diapherotrites archaeon]|tara:strand:+ start:6053 stop:6559 length:507 start_codon:yes stop_codon:yes gene_type:complete